MHWPRHSVRCMPAHPVHLHMRACAQKSRMEAAAQRDEKERGERQQARLQAEADAHARAVADRDRFLRNLAARTGVLDVRGTGPIPEALAAQCAPCRQPTGRWLHVWSTRAAA